MPSVIFACIISMSVAASICIILFFLLRIITKKLFSNTWHYYIWLAVVCLFLIPFKLNILNADFRFIPVATDEILKFTAPDLDVYEISAEPTEINPLVQIVKGLPLIWLGGVMFTLLYKVIMYSRFALFIKKMGVCSDKAMTEYAVHNSVKIKKAHINAPFLAGILTPVIYLPDVKLDDTEHEMVIAHEMTHFKRKDILYKLVIQAVLCIHWFNPLAYLMNRDMQKHCELSCDEKTISKMDGDKRKIYMKTILNLIGRTSAIQSSMTTAMGASKSETEKRIQMIIKNKKISAGAKYISVFAAVILLFVGILTASQFNAANAAIPDNMQDNVTRNDDFENIAEGDHSPRLKPGAS